MTALNEIIDKRLLVFITNEVIKYYSFLASLSRLLTGLMSSLLQCIMSYPTWLLMSFIVSIMCRYFPVPDFYRINGSDHNRLMVS